MELACDRVDWTIYGSLVLYCYRANLERTSPPCSVVLPNIKMTLPSSRQPGFWSREINEFHFAWVQYRNYRSGYVLLLAFLVRIPDVHRRSLFFDMQPPSPRSCVVRFSDVTNVPSLSVMGRFDPHEQIKPRAKRQKILCRR